ncbi:ATP-binding protein [Bradyrhizobium sp. 153]|uniref:ATP-binding protein n=1 Tax=unclassified Bradyrhizobium TaxID=2631580 RepID=UPI0031F95E69
MRSPGLRRSITLIEELTVRDSRRVSTALRMSRLTTVKTLAGFDFASSPRSIAIAFWSLPN